MSSGRFVLLAGLLVLAMLGFVPAGESARQPVSQPIPMLAYYYIWFDEPSWNRAKTDYPLLGNYSSDDREVMVQHVQWAQQAGIDGFIVSWKHTDVLDPRLAQLVMVAEELDFKLAIIYQGLDFERDPLPSDRIAADMAWFAENYAGHSVFDLFGRPVVIWSGTWKFTAEEIAQAVRPVRSELLVLGSARNLDDYLRIADAVEGNAYYWSSVDPGTFPGYVEKLQGMGAAVHARGGLWVAPAAPGFDARLIGGSRVVERRNGLTLLQQLQAARQSAPDAVGLISWNEFSENTHIEPSRNLGTQYLELLADISEVPLPIFDTFNSSDPPAQSDEAPPLADPPRDWRWVAAGGVVLVLLAGYAALLRSRSG